MQNIFGSGILWGTQTTDANGNAITNPTPVLFGTLQDVSIDFSFDNKMLHGQNNFPVAVGRGKGKITCKAKFAQVKGDVLGNLFFGQTQSNGILGITYDTTGQTIPSTPFQIVIAPPGTGTFQKDLGVISAVTGLPFKRVATPAASGEYSVDEATGTYTFDTSDTGSNVYINYSYSATSTSAKQQTVQNVPMGYTPNFRADIYTPYNGKSMVISLLSCVSNKFSIATKLDDFAIPEFDFDAFADPSGTVLKWSTTE